MELTTERFAKLFVYPPKNAWNAVLTQLICWSFRRFCVDRLTNDLSGSELWDSHFTLISDFAPPEFQPHLDNWMVPENLVHVGNLGQLDQTFRSIIDVLDKAVHEVDDEIQEELATLLDEGMTQVLEKWLGPVYAPYSIFPTIDEPDESIDMTKLNAVNYLLGRQLLLSKLKHRRMTHRAKSIRAATPIKTRRNKQNVQVRFSAEARAHDARRGGDQNNESQRKQREGDQVSHSQEERDNESKTSASDKYGNQEHSESQVHAESVSPSHQDATVSGAPTTDASVQQDNKEDEKERA
jgi:hypothetical protein